MVANHIKSFVKGTEEILSTMLGESLKTDRPYKKEAPFLTDSMVAVVGFNGDVRGQVVYSFCTDYAKKVVSLMCGMEIDAFDEMSSSALSELCNMISGRSATYFSETTDKRVDITPPTVLSGNDIKVSAKPPVLCIPFKEGEDIVLEINYSSN
ncbi:MAG: hypothetical protein FH756_17250 [Firmicutes bacterium]|nr:hypothetical protein [Bacillota bacterium]